MEKNKRVITLALAMLMLAGSTGITANAANIEGNKSNKPVVAVSENKVDKVDKVDETKLSKAAERLIALGIIQGRGEGNIAPTENITRAEVTTIILRARGIDTSAYAATKSFNDVSETAWYAKDLAIAKELDLVYGVGSNNFAPEKNVTNAELVTMLVRALNYEKTTDEEASFPIFHITKAHEAGILTKELNLDLNKVSTREDMFQLINNALDSKVIEPNALGIYAPSEFTMLEKFLGLKEYEVKIVDSGSLLGGLDADKIKVEGPFGKDGKIEVKELRVEDKNLLNIDNIFGDVKITINKDGKVVYAEEVTHKEMKTDKVVDVIREYREDFIRFEDSHRDYRVSDDLVILHNYELIESRNLRSLLKGETVKYEVVDNKVTKIVIENVREVAVFRELKNNVLEMISGSRINLKDMKEVKVYINGKPAKVEDLEKHDLIYKFAKGKEIIIKATRDKVEGKVKSVGRLNKTVKIDDKEYNASKSLKISLNNGSTVTNASLEDLVGAKVTAYLNSNKEIELIIGDVDASLESIFVVERVIRDSVDKNKVYDYVTLVNGQGKSVTYEVDRRGDLRGIERGDLVAASFYGDVVTDIFKVTKKANLKYHSLEELTNVTSNDVNTKRLTITDGRQVYYVDSEKTPVFTVGNRHVDVFDFADLNKFNGKIDMQLVIKDRDVVAIYITEELKLEEALTKGIVLDMYVTTENGRKVTNLEVELDNGDIENYVIDRNVTVSAFDNKGFGEKTNSISDIDRGEIVSLVVNKRGEVVELKEIALTDNLDLRNNIVKSVSRNSAKIGNKEYRFTPNALIVDSTSSRYIDVLTSPLDIPENSLVIFSLDRGDIDNLVIIGEKGDNFEDDLVYEKEFVKSVKALKSLVAQYKDGKDVELSELDALVKVAKEKLELVQSEAAVIDEIADYKALVKEIEGFKNDEAEQTEKVKAFKTSLETVKANLKDFQENEETKVTKEQLEKEVLEAQKALEAIKDKSELIKEIAELKEIAETVEKIEVTVDEPTPGEATPENDNNEELNS